MKKLLIIIIFLSLTCSKSTEPEDVDPPYEITLNFQNTRSNCASLVITYHGILAKCQRGTYQYPDQLEEGSYEWTVRLYDELFGDVEESAHGSIYISRDRTCHAANDSIYWE